MKLRKFPSILLIVFFSLLSITSFVFAQSTSESITWTLAASTVSTSPAGKQTTWLANEIEKRTDGRIKINIGWKQSLVKIKDALNALKMGMVDIAVVSAAYHANKTPMLLVLNYPYVAQDYWVGLKTATQLFDEDPAIREELEKWNIQWLVFMSTGQVGVQTKSKPIVKVDDFKGMKIRAHSPWQSWVSNFDGVPISMGFIDTADALDKGIIDGILQLGVYTAKTYGFLDKAKNYTMANMGAPTGFGMGINKNKWNALTPELQNIILGLREDFINNYAKTMIEEDLKAIEWAKNNNVKFFTLSPEENAKWKAAANELYESYIEKYEAKGYPARRLVTKMHEISERYTKELAEKGHPWKR